MTASSAPPLVVIVGPTASGKTELAVALCETLDGEVVSADSVQVYRHFEIGTGKPSATEKARAVHHLLDVCEPSEPLDAARWAALAEEAISDIRARQKTPIVCGGTFLYVRALLYGLASAPRGNEEHRKQHQALVEAEGTGALHRRLAAVDPESASRLNPNDVVRVSRALEVFEATGVPMSRYQADHGFRTTKHPHLLIGVQRERTPLDQRIRARVEAMFRAGFVEEVKALVARGFGQTRAMGAVGYKQIHAALLQSPALTPEEALVDAVFRATRIFARRQRTWLRDAEVTWVAPDGLSALAARLKERCGH